MKRKLILLHPFIFTLYPILILYYHNQDFVAGSYLIKPIVVSLILTTCLFFIFKLIIRSNERAALATTLFVVLFYSFGHIVGFIPIFEIGQTLIYDYYILLGIDIIIFIFGTLIITTSKRSLTPFQVYLTSVSVILVIIQLIYIGWSEYHSRQIIKEIKAESIKIEENTERQSPDIYYIILDAYARADILQEVYNYDNSDLINYLTEKGFFVAQDSTANYPQTLFSIASSLNFEYMNYLTDKMGREGNNRKPLRVKIANNNLYEYLKPKGYKFVNYVSAWTSFNKWLPADISMNTKTLNEFEYAFFNITPLGYIYDINYRADNYRKTVLYPFDHMAEITEINSPTFTYVHIVAPHPPFIFDEMGQPITPPYKFDARDGTHYFEDNPDREDYREKYKNEIIFLNKKLKVMIDDILNNSDQPPVIIIQSDHGPGLYLDWEHPENTYMKERMSILNAYYLPAEGKEMLSDSITPVNSFRVVLNTLFNAGLELIEDKSYFITWSHPYDFIDVTEQL